MAKDLLGILSESSGLTKEIIQKELGPMFKKLGTDANDPNLNELRRAVALYLQNMILDSTESTAFSIRTKNHIKSYN